MLLSVTYSFPKEEHRSHGHIHAIGAQHFAYFEYRRALTIREQSHEAMILTVMNVILAITSREHLNP